MRQQKRRSMPKRQGNPPLPPRYKYNQMLFVTQMSSEEAAREAAEEAERAKEAEKQKEMAAAAAATKTKPKGKGKKSRSPSPKKGAKKDEGTTTPQPRT